MQNTKYLIIGAGLSGLTTAYSLKQAGESDFLILESRDRVGGRIHTLDGIDLGATWFQNHHQHVLQLLDALQINKHHQYSDGKSVLVYSSMAPAHYFQSDPNAPKAYRVAQGSKAMIDGLFTALPEHTHLNASVSKIELRDNFVIVSTENDTYKAEKVIVTIPPQLAAKITYSPKLPQTLTGVMNNTHTWMSNAIKVGLTFDKPFWKDQGFSGMLIGQVGCVTELYDHTDAKENTFALMGFVNETLRDVSEQERKTKIIDYLVTHLGSEIRNYMSYSEKDWSKDSHTTCEGIKSLYMSPQYGAAQFERFYMDGKLLFSGTETSPQHGGYMDGAIFTGLRAVKKIING